VTSSTLQLSGAEARRVALRAQRLGLPRQQGEPTLQHMRELVSELGAVQLDAVNVVVRSHYLPIYSRLGPYPVRLLDELVYRQRAAFEYWGHAASFLPVELYPALRWRMAACAQSKRWRAFQARIEAERPGYLAAVERQITEHGPLAFGDLSDPARRERTPTKYADSTLLWYSWSDGKTALEGLFDAGRLAAAGRRGFERLYDLAERVIPAAARSEPAPKPEDAQRTLVLHAARALGVATARDLADYFRLPTAVTRARLRELVDAKDLEPATVDGWARPAYLVADAADGPVDGRALLSPFDSLLWERDRTERLFGFRHSFELYVKAPNRQYGYYVLPFLLADTLVGRVDLKADRARQTLLVLGAFAEPSADLPTVAGELAVELRELARWLECDAIEVSSRGNLASLLRGRMPGPKIAARDDTPR
jgi:uncharacterized protein